MKIQNLFILFFLQIAAFSSLKAQMIVTHTVKDKFDTTKVLQNINVLIVEEKEFDSENRMQRRSLLTQTNENGLATFKIWEEESYYGIYLYDSNNNYYPEYLPNRDLKNNQYILLKPKEIKYQLKVEAYEKGQQSDIPLEDVRFSIVDNDDDTGQKFDSYPTGEKNCRDLAWNRDIQPAVTNGNLMLKIEHRDYKTQFVYFSFNEKNASIKEGVLRFEERFDLERKTYPVKVNIKKEGKIEGKHKLKLEFHSKGVKSVKEISINSNYSFTGNIGETVVVTASNDTGLEIIDDKQHLTIKKDTNENKIEFVIKKKDNPQFKLAVNQILLKNESGELTSPSKFLIEVPSGNGNELESFDLLKYQFGGKKIGEHKIHYNEDKKQYFIQFSRNYLDKSSTIRMEISAEGYEDFESEDLVSYKEWCDKSKVIKNINLKSIYRPQEFKIKTHLSKVDSIKLVYLDNKENVIGEPIEKAIPNYKRNKPFEFKLDKGFAKFDALEIIITNKNGKCLKKKLRFSQACEKREILNFNRKDKFDCLDIN